MSAVAPGNRSVVESLFWDDHLITWKRTLQTASSERFLTLKSDKDAASADLHYLSNETVTGTVILLKEAGWKEEGVPKLLAMLDDDFLPEVDLAPATLTHTVVWGEVLANYEASTESK